jgi:hypothetical protein
VEFDFNNVAQTPKNNWEGYNELQVFGTNATVTQAPVLQAPILLTDVSPGYASNVAGGQEIFTASFAGSAPTGFQWQSNGVNIAGATNQTLILSDLTTNMTAGYNLLAFNAEGTNTTSVAPYFVGAAPAATNGIIYADAEQIGADNALGLVPTEFLPTWPIASGSLIAGQLPSTVGPGNFVNQDTAGGLPVLTDGVIGELQGDGGSIGNYATGGSSAGTYLIYTLNGSAGGYNINSIVTYGGWPDYGRDWQYYTVSYATVANPTNFITLGQSAFAYNNLNPIISANAGRVTWTSAGGGPLATGVAAVEFNFAIPAGQENGWQGYSELQVFGTPSSVVPPKGPTISSSGISGGNLVLAGKGGTPSAGFSWLTTTNVGLPLSEWTTNSTGTFDGGGNFSSSIPIDHSEPAQFFLLKTQ